MKWVKGLLIAFLVLFAVFYLVNNPEGAANFVEGVATWVIDAVNAIIAFFTSLAS